MNKGLIITAAILAASLSAQPAFAESEVGNNFELDNAQCIQVAHMQGEGETVVSHATFYQECMIERGYNAEDLEEAVEDLEALEDDTEETDETESMDSDGSEEESINTQDQI